MNETGNKNIACDPACWHQFSRVAQHSGSSQRVLAVFETFRFVLATYSGGLF
jgi:hypothetical protein